MQKNYAVLSWKPCPKPSVKNGFTKNFPVLSSITKRRSEELNRSKECDNLQLT